MTNWIAAILAAIFISYPLHAAQTEWASEWVQNQKLSIGELEKKLKSNDWHNRASSLLHIYSKNKQLGIQHARLLLEDPALVVRSHAIEILAKSESIEDQALLKKELFESRNFHRGTGLFTRKQILALLPKETVLKDQDLLAKLSSETDIGIQKYIQSISAEQQ